MDIVLDVNFDFTSDTPNYWKDFWSDITGIGGGNSDPDIFSPTLQKYHQILWSRQLPNGEKMCLSIGSGSNYLTWNNFRFGSDSITASFRYKKYKYMLEQLTKVIPNYQNYMETFIRKAYTIGGNIIFPKTNSINRARGINSEICDRWDLTLECIRRYYNNEKSPLYETLVLNKDFFDLFVDFKGYVDFFFIQDCVSSDYSSVLFWIGSGSFEKNPFPKSAEEYMQWISKELEFVEKRNNRIKEYIEKL
ncbi:MAG: hypothetical protein E7479_09205 [Ruminococcaceae bacterium]|nr:hypothetical protein [Oscillospiraceae bacterium]